MELVERSQFVLCLDEAMQSIHVPSTPEHHLIPDRCGTTSASTRGSIPELPEEVRALHLADGETGEPDEGPRSPAFVSAAPRGSLTVPPAQVMVDSVVDDARLGLQMLHGGGSAHNGGNRWYDKTMQFVVSRDGNCGLNYEHSPAEGIAVIRLIEHILHYMCAPLDGPPLECRPPAVGHLPICSVCTRPDSCA